MSIDYKKGHIKELHIDNLDENAGPETKRLYDLVVIIQNDVKYYNNSEKTKTYIGVFNIFHEWPDFMKPWIKDEYVHLMALRLVNIELKRSKKEHDEQLARITNELPECDTKYTIESLLDKLDNNELYIDRNFFNMIIAASNNSPLTQNRYSRISNLVRKWEDRFANLIEEKKKKIISQF